MAAAAVPRLAIIGSGLAGCAAALTAARAAPQTQVLVLDKETERGGNSLKANSGTNALTPEKGDSLQIFKADTLKSGGGRCHTDLVDLLVDRSQDALAWLEALGVELSAVSQTGGQSCPRTHSPPAGAPPIGVAVMPALQRSMEQQHNIEVRTGVKVTGLAPASVGRGWQLSTAQHREGGLPVEEQQLEAAAVVLATGGFAASQELLQRYAPHAAGLGTTNGPFAVGDGLELGQQAGAALVDVEHVQLNPTGIVDPAHPNAPTRTVAPEKLRGLGAILLDGGGRRFVNELGPRDEVAGAVLGLPGKQAVLLLGSATAAAFGPALEPYLSSGLFKQAASLQQLQEQAGLPAAAVAEELERYYQAAAAGRDAFGKASFPAPIDPTQPVYWARVSPVAHYCMGGLAIDGSARVLDGSGRPIPGLFAAGEVAGGVHGRNLLVGNSLLECVVFGRIAGGEAAQHAAAVVRQAHGLMCTYGYYRN